MPKILIVDDDTDFSATTANILKDAGFEPLQATSVADFMDKARNASPDLILLDISLENSEDGLLAAKDLFHANIKIPIIILENVATVATLSVDTAEIAVEAYAEKPLDKEKLVTKINAILNR